MWGTQNIGRPWFEPRKFVPSATAHLDDAEDDGGNSEAEHEQFAADEVPDPRCWTRVDVVSGAHSTRQTRQTLVMRHSPAERFRPHGMRYAVARHVYRLRPITRHFPTVRFAPPSFVLTV